MLVDLEDQRHMVKEWALMMGVPSIRLLHASRTLPGPEDVGNWVEPVIEALTRPLTEQEKESSKWEPPHPRILFEGTLDEADDFLLLLLPEQEENIPHKQGTNFLSNQLTKD